MQRPIRSFLDLWETVCINIKTDNGRMKTIARDISSSAYTAYIVASYIIGLILSLNFTLLEINVTCLPLKIVFLVSSIFALLMLLGLTFSSPKCMVPFLAYCYVVRFGIYVFFLFWTLHLVFFSIIHQMFVHFELFSFLIPGYWSADFAERSIVDMVIIYLVIQLINVVYLIVGIARCLMADRIECGASLVSGFEFD